MTREIEIRLIGHESADGELLAADALGIIGSFKDLAYRLTRSAAKRDGLGRTDAVLERLATVRVGLRKGSTQVVFVVGDQNAILDPLEPQVDAMFWSIIEGVGTNERPPEVSDSVADAVDRLVVALGKAAPKAEVAVPGYPRRMLDTHLLDRRPWQRQNGEEAGEMSVHGVLEMVDLHSRRFRLRDAAGNGIDLVEVEEPDEAARLVGTRVVATGVLAVGQGTQHHRMEGAHISPEPSVADSLGIQRSADLESLRRGAEAAPAPQPLDLSDDEIEDFLAEIRA
ncbi:hypothetical protein HJ588_02070 [Flexivirga sp. ID2601S]|uniref:Uncharacterized protein n=1 Tax=Flexivirga aerilata TaxID=1656889 RepID=A0A849AMM3_9MICO|nr:hypothetical protein [Flexivirga aerilata]NNG38062.1 hypothetical protein [Flexivirga aerilata]